MGTSATPSFPIQRSCDDPVDPGMLLSEVASESVAMKDRHIVFKLLDFVCRLRELEEIRCAGRSRSRSYKDRRRSWRFFTRTLRSNRARFRPKSHCPFVRNLSLALERCWLTLQRLLFIQNAWLLNPFFFFVTLWVAYDLVTISGFDLGTRDQFLLNRIVDHLLMSFYVWVSIKK